MMAVSFGILDMGTFLLPFSIIIHDSWFLWFPPPPPPPLNFSLLFLFFAFANLSDVHSYWMGTFSLQSFSNTVEEKAKWIFNKLKGAETQSTSFVSKINLYAWAITIKYGRNWNLYVVIQNYRLWHQLEIEILFSRHMTRSQVRVRVRDILVKPIPK